MSYEPKENTGALFKVQDKEDERYADYTGDGFINGSEFYIDAWIKTAKSGNKYLSIRFKAKRKTPPKTEEALPRVNANSEDDDIPF